MPVIHESDFAEKCSLMGEGVEGSCSTALRKHLGILAVVLTVGSK